MIRDWLGAPEIAEVDLDSSDRFDAHRAVLQRKPMLNEVFQEFHALFLSLDRRYFGDTPGLRIELGAGVAPIRDSDPSVLATDVVAARHLDRVLDAQALDLPAGSVRALYGQNCFHHIADPDRFFDEVMRVVTPGGGVILIEPYHSPAASMLFKRLFRSERFDKHDPHWRAAITGPMQGANQALSYIVFTRDRDAFRQRYPELEIVEQQPLGNYLRYLASGGLNFRKLAPDFSIPALKLAERLLDPLRRQLALHHVVVLRRIAR